MSRIRLPEPAVPLPATLLPAVPLLAVLLLAVFLPSCSDPGRTDAAQGSVIFIHPDGAGLALWTALRVREYGPDSLSEWDRLTHMGLYRSHQRNSISSTSHAGATVHAYGVKVDRETYGSVPAKPVRAASGQDVSIMIEALRAGRAVGVINSGHLCEPGTGVFLASAFSRYAYDSISAQIIESGADIILGGGEVMLLPEGVVGRHGQEGKRRDGRNLIDRARELGYAVVFDREELRVLPDTTRRVLGVFAAWNTFHDRTEEELAARGLPLYEANAPSVAEMTAKALELLTAREQDFLLVVEEEGTDNFSNANNAAGALEAARRADAAIGVARRHVDAHPRTLLVTAADSDAGLPGIRVPDTDAPLPPTDDNGAPLDGRDGTATPPFVSAPDSEGRRFPFGIAWASDGDLGAGVIARAHGWQAGRLPMHVDNTDIYALMYRVLFGKPPR